MHPLYRVLSVALLCVSFAVPAFAQSFPSKIVRIISPFTPGYCGSIGSSAGQGVEFDLGPAGTY